jgi:predicted transcriptional regulator
MSTTPLKIPEDLKRRTIDAAQQQGLSPHAFMVNAIEQTVLATEQRASFIAEALTAEQEMLESGLGYAAEDVHRYIKARVAGENPERPEARPWRG